MTDILATGLATAEATGADARPGDDAAWGMPRGLIVLLGGASAVLVVAGMQAFRGILAPTMLALMFTVCVSPMQAWLRRRIPTWLATFAALVVVYATLLLLILVLGVSIARLATLLPTYADQAQQLQTDLTDALARFGVGKGEIQTALSQVNLGSVVGVLRGVLSGLLGVFSNLLFLVTLLFFMVADAAGMPEKARAAGSSRPDLVTALLSFVSGTRQYLIVSSIFGAIVAVLDTAALYALGIPLAVLWGILSFITNYIPNIGFVIGVIPPALLGLLQDGPRGMIAVLVVYSVFNVVIQTIIQPRFVGDAVGLSTTLTFLSLIFWAWVLGPLGALLAIPMTLLAKALLLDIDPATKWASILISSGGSPGPEDVAQPGSGGDAQPGSGGDAQPGSGGDAQAGVGDAAAQAPTDPSG